MASGRVTGFGLMSSDSDFTPLVTRLRQEGLPVYGFGTDKTPQAFRSACTRFIDVGALTSARETPVELAESTEEPPSPDAPEVAPALVKLLIDTYNAGNRHDPGLARLREEIGRSWGRAKVGQ